MADVKAWKEGAPGEPTFPDSFEVSRKAVLQVTDIKTNRNKYYAVELHTAGKQFRVYTHYGRTDDLDANPDAGARESRYFDDPGAAQAQYEKIYREKTSASKGTRNSAWPRRRSAPVRPAARVAGRSTTPRCRSWRRKRPRPRSPRPR